MSNIRQYKTTLITATDEAKVLSEGAAFNPSLERAVDAVADYGQTTDGFAPEPVVEFWADGFGRAWLLDGTVHVRQNGHAPANVLAALRALREAKAEIEELPATQDHPDAVPEAEAKAKAEVES